MISSAARAKLRCMSLDLAGQLCLQAVCLQHTASPSKAHEQATIHFTPASELTGMAGGLHRWASCSIVRACGQRPLMIVQCISGLASLLQDVRVECVLSRGEVQAGKGKGPGG